MRLNPYRAVSILLAIILSSGCSAPDKPIAAGDGTGAKSAGAVPARPLKLSVDAASIQEGLTVAEKSREPTTLVLVFGATKKDHESSNYNRVLFAPDGKEISRTGMSIPAFAK